MKPVKEFVDEAIAKNYKVDALEGGIYMMDYPLAYQDGNRFQRVYVRDWYDERNKKQTYFINSYIADYTRNFDLERILREAEFGRMSMVCLKRIPDGQGGEKDALYTQATLPCSYINGSYEEFMAVVFEVASNADYIEKLFFTNDVS
jgi:hypothetical protein